MRLSQTSPEQVEVYRFNWLVASLVPALAIFFQAFIPVRLHFVSIFDFPLLVTIFFGVARRNPASGLFTGCTGRFGQGGARRLRSRFPTASADAIRRWRDADAARPG